MAYPNKVPTFDKYYTALITDISSSTVAINSVQIPIWASGQVVHVATCISTAITTGDAAITVSRNGTAITAAALTIANSSSAAGDIDSVDLADGAFTVKKGDNILIASDGGSTVVSSAGVLLVVREN